MAKITLADLSSLTNEQSAVAVINSNNALIETAIENALSRQVYVPNNMETELDMNSNRIINLPEAESDTEPVRKREFDETVLNLISPGLTPEELAEILEDILAGELTNISGPFFVGGDTVDRSGNSSIIVSKTKSGAGPQVHHAFSNTSTYSFTGNGNAVNSYDDQTIITGTGNWGHYAAYQNFMTYDSSGTIGSLIGNSFNFDVTDGTVTQVVGFAMTDVTTSGSGTVGTQYGILLPELTGAATNWAYFSAGATPSRIDGVVKAAHIVTKGQHMVHDVINVVQADTGTNLVQFNLYSGCVIRSHLTVPIVGPFDDMLPTSEAMGAYYVDDRNSEFFNFASFQFRYTNRTGGTATLKNGGDATISLSGDMTVPAGTSALFMVTFTDLTPGTCNYSFIRIDK